MKAKPKPKPKPKASAWAARLASGCKMIRQAGQV